MTLKKLSIEFRSRLNHCKLLRWKFNLINQDEDVFTKQKYIDLISHDEIVFTWNPSGDIPLSDLSQPQLSNSPLEQALVNAWATPALEIACTKADSRVPEEKWLKMTSQIFCECSFECLALGLWAILCFSCPEIYFAKLKFLLCRLSLNAEIKKLRLGKEWKRGPPAGLEQWIVVYLG